MTEKSKDRKGRTKAGRVTLADLARHAGVSVATVSMALRDDPRITSETRARVRQSVAALGYVYNRSAANLRVNRTLTVGLVICDLANPFFAELASGVDHALEDAGYIAYLANSSESPERQARLLRRLREQGVDGIILCPAAGSSPDLVHEVQDWGLPCVQTLRYLSSTEGDYAGVDYELGMTLLTEHLIRLGHERIVLLGGERLHSAALARHSGFQKTLQRHGLPEGTFEPTPLTRRAAAEAIPRILASDAPPTAAVCFNDVVALGAIRGLEDCGLTVGRDFAVTGFDDIPEAAESRPAITSVATKPWDIGAEAARLLLRRIKDPDGADERVILPPRLIVRQSCGGGEPASGPDP